MLLVVYYSSLSATDMFLCFGFLVALMHSDPTASSYREGAWFKNNFAKVLSACNYYAGVATTSNAVSFRSL